MMKELEKSVKFLTMLSVIFLLFTAVITFLSQILFYSESHGSLIHKNGIVIGSRLIAQDFKSDKYFHSRPSQTFQQASKIQVSSSRNLPVNSEKLEELVFQDFKNLALTQKEVKAEMITFSGSGLDPDITLSSAIAQAERVAKSRKLNENRVRLLIDKSSRYSIYSSERIVNVLELNLALDNLFGNVR